MKINNTKLTSAIGLALLSSAFMSQSQAAGFALIENSASGMGNAYAGAAAIAEDASTIWFNPAGMTQLSGSQMVIAGHFISPTADFTNNGSTLNTTAGSGPISGSNDDGGVSALVPNFYYATEIGNGAMFGIGITVPYGLSTEYDAGWVGRYTATKSEVHTLNINPSFAAKATDKLSVGFGLNIQYIEATLANQLDSASICQRNLVAAGIPSFVCDGAGLTTAAIGDPTLDSSQSLSGDDLNFGWNAGILYQIDDNAKLGVAYRSSIKHKLDGDVNFTVNPNLNAILTNPALAPLDSYGLFTNTGVIATVELPESLSISYARNMGDKLSVLADITWTRWSNFQELTVVFDNPYQGSSTIPENWDDSYRFSLGANYKQSDKLTLRAGVAVDQTPIRSPEDRTPRIPGDDRTWLSFGVGYNMSSDMSIDVGFSHLFVDDTEINNTDASFGHTVTGKYDADVNILSAQANLKF